MPIDRRADQYNCTLTAVEMTERVEMLPRGQESKMYPRVDEANSERICFNRIHTNGVEWCVFEDGVQTEQKYL